MLRSEQGQLGRVNKTNRYIGSIPSEVWAEFWEQSPQLSDAYWRYAEKDVRQKYLRLAKVGGPAAINRNLIRTMQSLQSAGAYTSQDPTTISKAFQDAVSPRRAPEYKQLADALQKQCRRWLQQGHLIAVGFNKQRKAEDTPVPLPNDLVQSGSFVWDSNRAFGGHLEMVNIRVGHINLLKRLSEVARNDACEATTGDIFKKADDEIAVDRRSPGRKSRRDQIIEAYEVLLADNVITEAATLPAKHQAIYEWVKARYPDPPSRQDGLSQETIRRVLTEHTQNTI